MTIVATRAPASRPAVDPLLPRRDGRLRRVALAVVRWAIAIVVIVVLGQLLTPVEARAAAGVASPPSGYGSNL